MTVLKHHRGWAAALLLLGVLPFFGFRCTLLPARVKQLLQPVSLTYWRVWDSPSDFHDIINRYRAIHPNIAVNVRTLRFEEFRDALLRAYAKGEAPDLISLPTGWLRSYLREGFIQPMPSQVTLAYQRSQRSLGLKEEVIIEPRTMPTLNLGQLQGQYVDAVLRDVVVDGKIYGLPLSVDTLVLLYNRELFNLAGLPLPPTSWQDFQTAVAKLTFHATDGGLAQSGAALGTSRNVRRAVDLLSLLMMQNGTAVMAENGAVQFHLGPRGEGAYHPGVEALRFYTDFANPNKQVYTWDASRPDSLAAFANGQVAMTFGYSFDLAEIRAISKGRLNFGVIPVPQIAGGREVNVANYWVETVSSRTRSPNEAWDFLLFASQPENVRSYLAQTGKPTALRVLINEQKANDALAPFASQVLTARSWYFGYDAITAESILKDLIDAALAGNDPYQATAFAAQRIELTAR